MVAIVSRCVNVVCLLVSNVCEMVTPEAGGLGLEKYIYMDIKNVYPVLACACVCALWMEHPTGRWWPWWLMWTNRQRRMEIRKVCMKNK